MVPASAALTLAFDTLARCPTGSVFEVCGSYPADSVEKIGQRDVFVRKMCTPVRIADANHSAFDAKLPTEPAPLVAKLETMRQHVGAHSDSLCGTFYGQS